MVLIQFLWDCVTMVICQVYRYAIFHMLCAWYLFTSNITKNSQMTDHLKRKEERYKNTAGRLHFFITKNSEKKRIYFLKNWIMQHIPFIPWAEFFSFFLGGGGGDRTQQAENIFNNVLCTQTKYSNTQKILAISCTIPCAQAPYPCPSPPWLSPSAFLSLHQSSSPSARLLLRTT